MPRKLLRQVAIIATGIVLATTGFIVVGWWRRSEDAKWCRRAVAADTTANGQPLAAELLGEVRSACAIQRARQRLMFGAVWRRGGQGSAECAFELARMQLIAYHDHTSHRAVLQRFGVDGADFDPSNRQHQDRFVKACLSAQPRQPK